jgi:hypothetical protein
MRGYWEQQMRIEAVVYTSSVLHESFQVIAPILKAK